MASSRGFRIRQIAPDMPLTWALTEKLYWSPEAKDKLTGDTDNDLFKAAYDAVEWKEYYERLKGTPFYDWAVEGGGILSFGGSLQVENARFFSRIGDVSTTEESWLRDHPEFNQVLHDVHVEAVGQMVDHLLGRTFAKRRRKRHRKSKVQQEIAGFKSGDSVVVKPGITDPDFGIDIGGWQGRLDEDADVDSMVLIAWDSVTLQNMPGAMIEQCEEKGLDWSEMMLGAHEVELTRPRDTKAAVTRVIDDLCKKYAWSWLGDEGKRIGKVLAGVDPDDEMAALHAWEDHLSHHLAFPFEAEVSESQDRGPVQAGDRVKVTGISLVDDLYGVVVDLRHGRLKYAFPLCDLEVGDERSPNHQLVRDYAVWFANR